MRDDDELHPHRVEFVDAEVIVHVGDELPEPLRIAEVAVVEAGDVGVLFHVGRSSLSGAAPARVAASVAPETASAPRNPRRLVLDMALSPFGEAITC